MTDTLERREAAMRQIRSLVIQLEMLEPEDLDLIRLTPQAALLREWMAKPAALSLPAREVSGERAREVDALISRLIEVATLVEGEDFAAVQEAIVELRSRYEQGVTDALAAVRSAGGHLVAGIAARKLALATTPAPREKLEADLVGLLSDARALLPVIKLYLESGDAQTQAIKKAQYQPLYDALVATLNRLSAAVELVDPKR